jgi:hypothetical protein
MKAWNGDPALKAAQIEAVRSMTDATEVESIADAAHRLGLPSWLAHTAETLMHGLPDDRAAQFPAVLLASIPVGADLALAKSQFIVAALSSGLDLAPKNRPAKLARALWALGKPGDADWPRDLKRATSAARQAEKAGGIQVRANERAAGRANTVAMRASVERLLASHVVAWQVAEAALCACSPRADAVARMMAPLCLAAAASAWGVEIAKLSPSKAKGTGTTREQVAAAAAQWPALTPEAEAVAVKAHADACTYLATVLLNILGGAT